MWVGAGAELLPRGTLLPAALVAVATAAIVVAVATDAAAALLFEGNGAFLFETNAILLDIAGEARSDYWRRLASAAEIVEVGKNGEDETYMAGDLARNIHLVRAQVDPRGID